MKSKKNKIAIWTLLQRNGILCSIDEWCDRYISFPVSSRYDILYPLLNWYGYSFIGRKIGRFVTRSKYYVIQNKSYPFLYLFRSIVGKHDWRPLAASKMFCSLIRTTDIDKISQYQIENTIQGNIKKLPYRVIHRLHKRGINTTEV